MTGNVEEATLLDRITPDEIREIARLSKAAREAQDRLLNKMKIEDKFKDQKELALEVAGTLGSLEASAGNGSLQLLKKRLASLPPEARHELLAVLWIGRGDFAPREWQEALDEAQGRSTDGDVDYIAERGPLHDYLAKGLYLLKRP